MPILSGNEVVKLVSEREGKTKNQNAGEIQEMLGVIADLIYENDDFYDYIIYLGHKRSEDD